MDPLELAFVNFSNAEEIERLYQNYLKDPKSVDSSFVDFFKGLAFQGFKGSGDSDETKIQKLIEAYRKFGHLKANLNPVALERKDPVDHLSLEKLGFKLDEHEKLFPTCGLFSEQLAKLKAIEARLIEIYSSTLGVECDIPSNPELESFVFKAVENDFPQVLSSEEKKRF